MPRPAARSSDVVVVGGGPAGMSAALAATQAGVSVTLLETRNSLGGNAVYSAGYVAFVGIRPQRNGGIKDSPHEFLNDARLEVELQRRRYGLYFDEDLWLKFGRRSSDAYELLLRLGFRFNRIIPRPNQHRTPRMWALESTAPFNSAFAEALSEARVEVVYETRAMRLKTANGRIAGVVADGPLGERLFEARRGVILAAGGFQANRDYRERYQPHHLAVSPYQGIDTCRGDAHVMASAAGADLINMTMIPPLVMIASSLVEDCIAVNLDGHRFHDEAGPYDSRVDALLAQPKQLAYYVCDSQTLVDKERLVAQMLQVRQAANIDAAATMIGCDENVLAETIAAWNAFLGGNGKRDADFGRVVLPEGRRGIVEPPYLIMPMTLGISPTGGGLRTNNKMGVLDTYGNLIIGLFAAGDCVGSINAAVGLGGIHIGSALTLGMVAGSAAAR